MRGVPVLEKRIIVVATAFVLTLFGLAALAINLFQVGLPTCLADIKPFQKGELITHSPTHYELHYVARMWRFEPEEAVVPAGSTVDIYVSTPDVVHGLILLGTDLNLMAVPGVVNYTRVRLEKPGSYQLLCHEFCGTGHERMTTNIRVVDAETFRARSSEAVTQTALDPRYQLLEAKDCMTCHSVDGEENTGPTLKGIYGRTVRLANGQSVTADDEYLRESIMKPEAKIVADFDDLMPVPEITEEQLTEIIEYLKTLK